MHTQDNTQTCEIVPFRAEHIEQLQIENKDHLVYKIPHLLTIYEQLETSHTYIHEGEILCCAGIIPYWEGVGEAWFVIPDDIDKAKVRICSTVKRYLDNVLDTHYRRIQATARADNEKAIRFLEWLGFKREALLEKYGIEGDDYYLYARL